MSAGFFLVQRVTTRNLLSVTMLNQWSVKISAETRLWNVASFIQTVFSVCVWGIESEIG